MFRSLISSLILPTICILSQSTAQAQTSRDGVGHITWSPDGTKLVFYANWDGDTDIYVINRDGSALTAVTDTDETELGPAFSRDGKRIYFEHRSRDGDGDIYVASVAGGDPRKLFGSPEIAESFPVEAPDGRISFTSGDSNDSDIHIWDPQTQEVSVLVNTDARDGVRGISWAPDGSKFLFSSNRTGAFEIYVADADGSNQARVTFHSNKRENAISLRPSFAPDGRKFAYWSDVSGMAFPHHHYHLHDLVTGEDIIYRKYNYVTSFPYISPDGTELAYTASVGEQWPFEIFVRQLYGDHSVRRVWPEYKR